MTDPVRPTLGRPSAPLTGKDIAVGGGGAALAVLLAAAASVMPFTADHEGKRNVAYHDISHPKDPRYDAACFGHTLPGSAGRWFSDPQCRAFLTADEQIAARGIAKCLSDKPLPFGVAKSFVDTALNLGVGGFCKSSMRKKANAGDLAGACRAISLYTYSGGKDCRLKASRCGGITDRRQAETELCMKGLK